MRHFEPFERRLEVRFRSAPQQQLEATAALWRSLVTAAGADVISVAHHQQSTAFILSTSSLFIFPGRFVLITCQGGGPSPVLREFLNHLHPSHVLAFKYEERCSPDSSCSGFEERVQEVPSILELPPNGLMQRKFAFGSESWIGSPEQLSGCPHLTAMYGITDSRMPELAKELSSLAIGFSFDQYFFSPQGYSCNFLAADSYISLHVSPESAYSYASLEVFGSPLVGREVQATVLRYLNPCTYLVR